MKNNLPSAQKEEETLSVGFECHAGILETTGLSTVLTYLLPPEDIGCHLCGTSGNLEIQLLFLCIGLQDLLLSYSDEFMSWEC